jgi:hypothetical protein
MLNSPDVNNGRMSMRELGVRVDQDFQNNNKPALSIRYFVNRKNSVPISPKQGKITEALKPLQVSRSL